MRGTHLEHQLLLVTQVERPDMSAPTQVPDVHLMTVFAAEQQVGLQSGFDHVRRAPLATDQCVKSQMPPEIVMQKLWAAVHFPLAQNIERFAIEHENAARTIAIGRSKRADVNAFRPTVNGVRT